MYLGIFVQYILPAIVLAGIGAIFGVLIAIFSKVFFVKIDGRIEKVTALLPGYNCGACGMPGCQGLAEKIVSGEKSPTDCKPIKPQAIEQIRQYLAEANAELEKNK
jgi:electron transport complex protein RnfB